MKNKKLFAILTLVCFMFTLMPVAAFAAGETLTATPNADGSVTFKTNVTAASDLYTVDADGKYTVDAGDLVNGAGTYPVNYVAALTGETTYAVVDATGNVLATAAITVDMIADARQIVAANNATAGTTTAVNDLTEFKAVEGDQTVTKKAAAAGIDFVLTALDSKERPAAYAADTLYIWAEDEAGDVTSALSAVTKTTDSTKLKEAPYVYRVNQAVANNEKFELTFDRAGEYKVFIGVKKAATAANVDDLKVLGSQSVITVKSGSADPEKYSAKLADGVVAAADSTFANELTVDANNVMSQKYVVKFYDADGTMLKGKTVAIETNSSSIEVNVETATTNERGEITFRVAGSVEGIYEIDFTIDGVTWTARVQVGNTAAAAIEAVDEPTAPLALWADFEDEEEVAFVVTDINGNAVASDNKAAVNGMVGIYGNDADVTVDGETYDKGSFVVLTEKPADSDLTSADLGLAYDAEDQVWYLTGVNTMDAEGTYSVKVILDNGAYATASWEVKKFQTPVQLVIGTSTNVVELGGKIGGELLYFDVNGVQKAAKDAKIAATGYAVESVVGNQEFQLVAKDDEKYVGATITVTAVSEKYDLVATKDITVADGAVAIAFVDKSADTNVNNKLEWNVVDSTGTRVALGNEFTKADIKYIVLDAPEGAKVSTYDASNLKDLKNKGIGKLSLTSNKVGNVAVQVIVKAEYASTNNEVANQIKYYTGTQIFAVGNGSVGDVVVMSIGSNEIVINDAKATIDAAPIVENNRTFVPFRALAEAFGATVAYDETTQSVTAELNGVTVVMTIGSATYTVNGVEKTADVAPFINGSRTMVPVRFAAEAFGIKVIPTYDENGATADILFNL